jgi:hypothetical protein
MAGIIEWDLINFLVEVELFVSIFVNVFDIIYRIYFICTSLILLYLYY